MLARYAKNTSIRYINGLFCLSVQETKMKVWNEVKHKCLNPVTVFNVKSCGKSASRIIERLLWIFKIYFVGSMCECFICFTKLYLHKCTRIKLFVEWVRLNITVDSQSRHQLIVLLWALWMLHIYYSPGVSTDCFF